MASNTSKADRKQVKGRRGAHLPQVSKATQFKPNNPETGEKDPRINREGRKTPKDVQELNALIDEILNEDAEDTKGNRMQKARVVINRLIMSKSPAGQIHILDRRFGKVPQAVELGGADGKPIELIITYATDNKPS